MNILMTCGIILLISCLCLSLVSGVWGYEAYTIDNAGMCDPEINKIVLYNGLDPKWSKALCIFNQDMIAYKYNLVHSDNYNEKYDEIFQSNYNKGYIHVSDYFNNYFSGVTAPPSNINTIYCNKDFTICNNDIKLTESILYKGIDDMGNIFFYVDLNLLIDISGNVYTNLNDFINDSNKYANPHPDFLQFYILKKQISDAKKNLNFNDTDLKAKQSLFDQLQLECVPFQNYSTLITTLKQSLLGTLNDNLLQQYHDLLQSKMKIKQMTTFEFFMYYAVSSTLNYTSYSILTR